jgi:hypothetical protein
MDEWRWRWPARAWHEYSHRPSKPWDGCCRAVARAGAASGQAGLGGGQVRTVLAVRDDVARLGLPAQHLRVQPRVVALPVAIAALQRPAARPAGDMVRECSGFHGAWLAVDCELSRRKVSVQQYLPGDGPAVVGAVEPAAAEGVLLSNLLRLLPKC